MRSDPYKQVDFTLNIGLRANLCSHRNVKCDNFISPHGLNQNNDQHSYQEQLEAAEKTNCLSNCHFFTGSNRKFYSYYFSLIRQCCVLTGSVILGPLPSWCYRSRDRRRSEYLSLYLLHISVTPPRFDEQMKFVK